MSSVLIADTLAIGLFIVTIFGVLIGYPIAFTLAGFSLMFAGLAGCWASSTWYC